MNMNTNEQNKRPEQEKVTSVAPNTGSDKKQPIAEPAKKVEEKRQSQPAS